MLRRSPIVLLATGTMLVACTGSIDPSNGTGGPTPVTPPKGGHVDPPVTAGPLPPLGDGPFAPDRNSPACKNIDPGPSPLRRLTRGEYDNAVRDLLGDTRHPGRG